MGLDGRILHDDGRLIAVDKPAGLATTGRDLDDPDCLQHLVAVHARRGVWAVHQLDRETSGVVLFVTRKSAVDETARRLHGRGALKLYLAFCRGRPGFEHLVVDQPLASLAPPPPRPHAAKREGSAEPRPTRTPATGGELSRRRSGERSRTARADFARVPPPEALRGRSGESSAAPRPARTRIEVLTHGNDAALLACRLDTGRTHQIRRHLAAIGHPLLGESRYVEPACARHPRQALHAFRLALAGAAAPRFFEAPLPADLLALARALGIEPGDVLRRRGLL